jgi:hypothetical protein
MIQLTRRPDLAAAAAFLVAVTLAVAAPAPETTTDVIKDRTGFIPLRKHQPLPGKIIGVLVSDVAAMMNQEGRSGPPDSYGFSRDGHSYRWVFVPVKENPPIPKLEVKVGEKGDRTRVYSSLSMANANSVKQWNIDVPFALVEVEVNDQLGAPAEEGFAGTKMKRLDGTRDYPLQVAEVVAEVRKKHKALMLEQEKAIAGAMAETEKQSLKDRKLTGPRTANEIFYITWMPETERLRIHFRTTITDGAFQTGTVPIGRGRTVTFGTTIGLEMGYAFEVSKSGKIDRILTLPIQTFTKEVPPPAGVRVLPPNPAPMER